MLIKSQNEGTFHVQNHIKGFPSIKVVAFLCIFGELCIILCYVTLINIVVAVIRVVTLTRFPLVAFHESLVRCVHFFFLYQPYQSSRIWGVKTLWDQCNLMETARSELGERIYYTTAATASLSILASSIENMPFGLSSSKVSWLRSRDYQIEAFLVVETAFAQLLYCGLLWRFPSFFLPVCDSVPFSRKDQVKGQKHSHLHRRS